ncbi:TetR family transcriptional regulator [Simiduia curdlanivorans]|uniref:TetR/AcrR family transcriptional regulator n=1 Tax=Simiduia curdlanivorans TaxID=1492769 RepID=A0ABV8V0C0_9GAMM|nr:TetR family transcriptional regulator [Simiduia curdlanivorans]MDN3637830.1 TetR family transcriptional regulator [Simiduia curdlanivorans]
MAWSPNHKKQTREKILHSAARLFTQRGFDHVGIDDVMTEAGLTRGAFYAHFKSKSELYAEAIVTAALAAQSTLLAALPERPSRQQVINAYLSNAHRRGDSASCPLAFLTTDISQRDPLIRAAYTQVFKGFLNELEPNSQARENALRSAVLMIGGMAIARALDDEDLVGELFSACQAGASR